jgi:hypothetical protein
MSKRPVIVKDKAAWRSFVKKSDHTPLQERQAAEFRMKEI